MPPVRNSPAGKHIGTLPAQHPADWTNIRPSPRAARRRLMAARAAGVAEILAGGCPPGSRVGSGCGGPAGAGLARAPGQARASEQPERLGAVADQEVLGLAVVLQHHLPVLAADAGDLVTAERGARWVLVVAVGPHPARLDGTAHAEGPAAVTGPDAGAQTVERVVGDLDRLGLIAEGGHGQDRAEDLLLEYPHLVVPPEHGRLVEVPAGELPADLGPLPADQDLGSFAPADLHVGADLLQLLGGYLRADHGLGVQRVALLDLGDPGQRARHELLEDVLGDERARRAGADLALVERVQHQALDGLVQELIVSGHDVAEEDVRRLAAQLQRDWDQVLRRVLHDQPAGDGFTGEGYLGDPRIGRERLADLAARA